MNALVTNGSSLLGASLIRALRWEGHGVTAVVSSLNSTDWLAADPGVVRIPESDFTSGRYVAVLKKDDVVFDTSPDSVAMAREGTFARFTTGAIAGPGDGEQSPLGKWIEEFLQTGRVRRAFGGARVTDARDVALAMISAAEYRVAGDFAISGPYVEYEQILGQLEWVTGRSARSGGVLELAAGPSEIRGEVFGFPMRPLRETVADIVSWHTSDRHASCLVA